MQTQDDTVFLINSRFLCNSFFILEAYLAHSIYLEYKYDDLQIEYTFDMK